MNEKRQNNRVNPASEAKVGNEASDNASRGTEARITVGDNESLAVSEQLMEEVLAKENLKQAANRVMQNKGAAGIDGMKAEELPAYLAVNWKTIREKLLKGEYCKNSRSGCDGNCAA